MTGNVVLAMYQPKAGKTEALLALVEDHVPLLRRLGLATDREVTLLEAEDGTLIEIFEWADADAPGKAHGHPEVKPIWDAMGEVANFVPLAELPESTTPFPHFRVR